VGIFPEGEDSRSDHGLGRFFSLCMRSRVRFPVLPWEFSLKGRIPMVTMVWVGFSESLPTNHEVPGLIPGSTVGIFSEGEDSCGDHGLGRFFRVSAY